MLMRPWEQPIYTSCKCSAIICRGSTRIKKMKMGCILFVTPGMQRRDVPALVACFDSNPFPSVAAGGREGG